MDSGGGAVVQGQAAQGAQGQAAAGGGRTGWQLLRSILFQMVVFYAITSFFRGRQQAPPANPEGRHSHPSAGTNLFPKGQDLVRGGHYLEYLSFHAVWVCEPASGGATPEALCTYYAV